MRREQKHRVREEWRMKEWKKKSNVGWGGEIETERYQRETEIKIRQRQNDNPKCKRFPYQNFNFDA